MTKFSNAYVSSWVDRRPGKRPGRRSHTYWTDHSVLWMKNVCLTLHHLVEESNTRFSCKAHYGQFNLRGFFDPVFDPPMKTHRRKALLVEAVTGKKGKTLHVAWEPRKLVDMIVTCVRIENIFWNLSRIKRVTCCADARFLTWHIYNSKAFRFWVSIHSLNEITQWFLLNLKISAKTDKSS